MLHIKSFHYLFTFIDFLLFFNGLWIYSHHTFVSGDIKLNPEQKRDINQCFSACYWNLKSVASHNFSKNRSLIAYNCLHKFNMICLSESHLNIEILSSDSNLQIPVYNFARMDHPSNTKRGGVCLYYKFLLPLKVIDVSSPKECTNFQVKIGDKTYNFGSLYRSPSQAKNEFENFIKNLELNLNTFQTKAHSQL